MRQDFLNAPHALGEGFVPNEHIDALPSGGFPLEHPHHRQHLLTLPQFIIGESPRAPACIDEWTPTPVDLLRKGERLKTAVRIAQHYSFGAVARDDVVLVLSRERGEI